MTPASGGCRATVQRSTTCATCRSGTSWRGSIRSTWTATRASAALVAKGRGFTEDDKRAAARRRARAAERGHPGVPRRGRARADRAVGVAVLPPDPAAAVRHRHLPAHASRCRAMPRQPFRHPEDAARAAGRAPCAATSGCSASAPVGLWPSEGSVSDAMVPLVARRGLPLDGDRRADPGADARHRLHAAMATGTSISPSGSTRRTSVTAGGARGRVRVPRPRAVGSDRLHLRGLGRRTPPPTTSSGAWSRPAAGYAQRPAGKSATISVILDGENAWEHFEGGGRPFLRALYRRLSRPSRAADGDDGRGVREPPRTLTGHLSRAPGSTPTSTSGSATPTTSAPGASWPRRATRSTRPRPRSMPRALARGARGNAHRRRQRLVLVVRRRPFVGPRSRVRRPVPAAPAERLPAAAAVPFRTSCSSATSRRLAARLRSRCRPAHIEPRLDGEETELLRMAGRRNLEVREVAGAMHQVERQPASAKSVSVRPRALFIRLDSERAAPTPGRRVDGCGHVSSAQRVSGRGAGSPAGVVAALWRRNGSVGQPAASDCVGVPQPPSSSWRFHLPRSGESPGRRVVLRGGPRRPAGRSRAASRRPCLLNSTVPDDRFEARNWSV